ncbi:MAG: terminase [Sphingomonas sp.]|nr:MAG: terminase [Sphingomonas sp.]
MRQRGHPVHRPQSAYVKAAHARLLERQLHLERREADWRARNGLLGFTLRTMPSYEVNWHHRLVCKHLNKVADGSITRLILSMPPRTGKTQLVSRQFPAFFLGQNPDAEIIAASYGSTLALNNSRDVQRIMMSAEYTKIFPNTRLADSVPGAKRWVQTAEQFRVVDRRGGYTATSVGASGTGLGADCALVDDPFRDWQDSGSKLMRDRVWDWYTSVLYTRQSKHGRIIVVNTRWHEDDLVGRLVEQANNDPEADQWTVINLPAIKEDPAGEMDPRQPGEALWPQRFPVEKLNVIRRNSERVWVSLYQGRPSPPEGNILKREWWGRYSPADLPDKFDSVSLSVDPTFDANAKSDYNCFMIMGMHRAYVYILHMVNLRLDFTQQLALLKALDRSWPLRAKWIENTANGAALINTAKKTIPGLIAITPQGSKVARAEAVTPYIQAGNVLIPQDGDAPWVGEFVEQCASFPNGKNDDIVDALSQGLTQLFGRRQTQSGPPMGILKPSSRPL